MVSAGIRGPRLPPFKSSVAKIGDKCSIRNQPAASINRLGGVQEPLTPLHQGEQHCWYNSSERNARLSSAHEYSIRLIPTGFRRDSRTTNQYNRPHIKKIARGTPVHPPTRKKLKRTPSCLHRCPNCRWPPTADDPTRFRTIGIGSRASTMPSVTKMSARSSASLNCSHSSSL